jgi:hypothetical protein
VDLVFLGCFSPFFLVTVVSQSENLCYFGLAFFLVKNFVVFDRGCCGLTAYLNFALLMPSDAYIACLKLKDLCCPLAGIFEGLLFGALFLWHLVKISGVCTPFVKIVKIVYTRWFVIIVLNTSFLPCYKSLLAHLCL